MTSIARLYKAGMLDRERKEEFEKLMGIEQKELPKGEYISYDVVTVTRVGCPKCQTQQTIEYGEDPPDTDDFICKVCGTKFEVDFWDEEKEEPILPKES